MEYQQFTPEIYHHLINEGYKYLIQGYEQLEPAIVGHEDVGVYAHYEIIPVKTEPKDWDMDNGAYYDIESPEALAFIGEEDSGAEDYAEGSYDTYFWIKKQFV